MSEKNEWVVDLARDGYYCMKGTAAGWSVHLGARQPIDVSMPRLWAYRNPAGTVVGHESGATKAKQAAARVARTGHTF